MSDCAVQNSETPGNVAASGTFTERQFPLKLEDVSGNNSDKGNNSDGTNTQFEDNKPLGGKDGAAIFRCKIVAVSFDKLSLFEHDFVRVDVGLLLLCIIKSTNYLRTADKFVYES